MEFWIAILITLAVLGSVLWVLPSPREKALTLMRHQAMGFGLKVRLVDSALAAKLFPWLQDYRGYVMYEKYLPSTQKWCYSKTEVLRLSTDEYTHEIDVQNPTKLSLQEAGLFDQLPESSEALIIFSGGIACLWKENIEKEGVERVNKCLVACVNKLEK